MGYSIGKGQYAGKGGKNFPVEIMDDEGKTVCSFTVYGSHKTAKEKAKAKIKELSGDSDVE